MLNTPLARLDTPSVLALSTRLFERAIAPNSNLAYDSESANAFASLPSIIQKALLQQKRIICIANNPSIKLSTLEDLLQPTDILVLFNHFIHAEFFITHPLARALPKLLFFRQIGDSPIHFGMPPRSNHVSIINTMHQYAPLGLLFSNIRYQFAQPHADLSLPEHMAQPTIIPDALRHLLQVNEHCRVLWEHHPVVADYPYFTDIHSSAPSSGFLLYRLLLAARAHVQHLTADTAALEMVMLGFNNEDKTQHFWSGHNWAFERQALATAPAGVQIIRQY